MIIVSSMLLDLQNAKFLYYESINPELKVVTGGRGWTSSTPGHLHTALCVCRAHGDVTHGGLGLGGFVSCPYSFPQHCMPYRLSVGAGLLQPFFGW